MAGCWPRPPPGASAADAAPSALRREGHAPCALVAWKAHDQAGVARPEGEDLEIILVEGVLHPREEVPAVVRAEADPEVGKRIALDVRVERPRRVGREFRARTAVEAEIGLSGLAKQVGRPVVFEAVASRPFRD